MVENNSKYKIYSLIDPKTNEVRYIGYTSLSLDARLKSHIEDAKRPYHTSHKCCWIRKLLKLNRLPLISIIDTAETLDEATALEVYHISIRINLTNSTTGGEKSKAYRADVKLKMSINGKGKKGGKMYERTEAHKQNHANLLREKYSTEEVRSFLRSVQTCRPIKQYGMDGIFIKSYDSLREAANDGFGRKEISRCLSGKHKQHKGFLWKVA